MNVKPVAWIRILNIAVATLLIVGGLNWGLIGLFHFDMLAQISGRMEFGETNLLSRLIYTLVGVAAGVASFQGCAFKGLKHFWKSSQEDLDVPAPARRRSWITLPWNIPPQEESKPKT